MRGILDFFLFPIRACLTVLLFAPILVFAAQECSLSSLLAGNPKATTVARELAALKLKQEKSTNHAIAQKLEDEFERSLESFHEQLEAEGLAGISKKSLRASIATMAKAQQKVAADDDKKKLQHTVNVQSNENKYFWPDRFITRDQGSLNAAAKALYFDENGSLYEVANPFKIAKIDFDSTMNPHKIELPSARDTVYLDSMAISSDGKSLFLVNNKKLYIGSHDGKSIEFSQVETSEDLEITPRRVLLTKDKEKLYVVEKGLAQVALDGHQKKVRKVDLSKLNSRIKFHDIRLNEEEDTLFFFAENTLGYVDLRQSNLVAEPIIKQDDNNSSQFHFKLAAQAQNGTGFFTEQVQGEWYLRKISKDAELIGKIQGIHIEFIANVMALTPDNKYLLIAGRGPHAYLIEIPESGPSTMNAYKFELPETFSNRGVDVAEINHKGTQLALASEYSIKLGIVNLSKLLGDTIPAPSSTQLPKEESFNP